MQLNIQPRLNETLEHFSLLYETFPLSLIKVIELPLIEQIY